MSGMCPDCMASPCDCNEQIWNAWCRHRSQGTQVWYDAGARNFTRSDIAEKVLSGRVVLTNWDIGPVQRITEPPHLFDEPTDQYELTAIIHQRKPDQHSAIKCHLTWCKDAARVGAAFCSDRCRDYDTKRAAIYHRLESYKTKLARHADKGMPKAAEVALASEITWAEQQTKSEVETLERQWRALTWR